jgi:hypothetical protein
MIIVLGKKILGNSSLKTGVTKLGTVIDFS